LALKGTKKATVIAGCRKWAFARHCGIIERAAWGTLGGRNALLKMQDKLSVCQQLLREVRECARQTLREM
jgi:hypothetical protein